MKIDLTSSAQCGSDALTTSMTDVAPHIANIINNNPGNNSFYLPGSGYTIASSIQVDNLNCLYGDGTWPPTFVRTGNFGDTFVIGGVSSSTVPAGTVRIHDLSIYHGTSYVTGDTSINYPATSGAHFKIRGAQNLKVENVWTSRLPYNYIIEGGSFLTFTDVVCQNAIWDYTNSSLQESVAQIILDSSTNFGHPTIVRFKNCQFTGSLSPSRNVNYNGVNVTQSENIGAQYNLIAYAAEDLCIDGTGFGGSNIGLFLSQKSGQPMLGVRSRNNYYDASRTAQVWINPQASSAVAVNVGFIGDQFDGENNTLNGILVSNPYSSPVVYGMDVHSCQMIGHNMAPLAFWGAARGSASDNTITGYNAVNASSTDGQWCSAGVFGQATRNYRILNNRIGGGPYTGHQGFSLISGMTDVSESGTDWF